MSIRVRGGISSGKVHTLPENPHFIKFERSDGDEKMWYTNTERVVDSEGHVNYYHPVDINDSNAIKWRIGLGVALSGILNLPDGPDYVLEDWPAHFRLFDHHKGKADNPRHDLYLCGSKSRFRSVPEFTPHARWLLTDPTVDRANCGCKYCSGSKTQSQISTDLGLNKRGSSSPGPSTQRVRKPPAQQTGKQPRERPPREKPYAAVQKQAKNTKPRDDLPRTSVLPVREKDLRAMHVYDPTHEIRKYRRGELLWCALQNAISGPVGDLDAISLWPAMVQEYSVRAETSPAEEGSSAKWAVRQSTVYKMVLLGTKQVFYMSDEHVLPFQAYIPSKELLQCLSRYTTVSLKTAASFDPLSPGLVPHTFDEAAPHFAFAFQTGTLLARFWALSDECEFKTVISPAPGVTPKPSTATSLSSAIMNAGKNNASTSSISSAPIRKPHNATGPNGLTLAALDSLSTRMLGPAPTIPTIHPQTVTQMRYQGLWWGPERIWLGELVRLKISRKQIGKAADLFAPSQAASHLAEQAQAANHPADLSANTRGVFLRIESLFAVEVPSENGATKECRASGSLYELADEEFVETESRSTLLAGNGAGGKGRGKGKEPASNPPPISPSKTHEQLPNFDPAVPVSGTTDSVLAQAAGQEPPQPFDKRPGASSHTLVNEPPHPLPTPPAGYKFRPILPKGHEFCVSLSLISGRYYPRLLSHPMIAPIINKSLNDMVLLNHNYLWAFDGLVSGFFNAVDPEDWKPTREDMVLEAEQQARGMFNIVGEADMEASGSGAQLLGDGDVEMS